MTLVAPLSHLLVRALIIIARQWNWQKTGIKTIDIKLPSFDSYLNEQIELFFAAVGFKYNFKLEAFVS